MQSMMLSSVPHARYHASDFGAVALADAGQSGEQTHHDFVVSKAIVDALAARRPSTSAARRRSCKCPDTLDGSQDTSNSEAREDRMITGFFPATTMPDADWWQALWPDPAKVLAEMGVEPGIIVVDLCCGDGLFTVPLARIAQQVYAIDLDPVMLHRTRICLAAVGAANCEFLVADAMTVDQVVPEPVDYVFLANTFHGVPDQLGLARAVAALLKPNGQFGVVSWHRRPREET